MSMRSRLATSSSSTQPPISAAGEPEPPLSPPRPRPPPTWSQRTISQTLQSTANLANLLPTGTLLAFQLLVPVFTNNGAACDAVTRTLTLLLLLLLAASCFAACFTDSLRSPTDGRVYYGIATSKGMWLLDYPDPEPGRRSGSGPGGEVLPDLRKYRVRAVDIVHGVLSVLVFGTVAFRDKNVVGCLYPDPGKETREVLDIVPIGVGVICSLLFVVFPTKRHGIGYPITHPNK